MDPAIECLWCATSCKTFPQDLASIIRWSQSSNWQHSHFPHFRSLPPYGLAHLSVVALFMSRIHSALIQHLHLRNIWKHSLIARWNGLSGCYNPCFTTPQKPSSISTGTPVIYLVQDYDQGWSRYCWMSYPSSPDPISECCPRLSTKHALLSCFSSFHLLV